MAESVHDGRSVRMAFRTLGCRLNQVDTEGMKISASDAIAIDVVPWDSEADVYVLNSCTVTGKADQECRRLARQAKKRHPHSKVVVAGCYAQTQPGSLLEIAEVDGVVGNTDKHVLAAWLPAVLEGGQKVLRVREFSAEDGIAAPLIREFAGRSRAYVKVQDGCDLRCAYCLIWRARGPGRSRPVAEVLRQLAALQVHGFREVVLAGVHLGRYGRDLSPRIGLSTLLSAIVRNLPSLRIRLSSIHPNEVRPDLLCLLQQHGQLRPHLHLSLQSGADAVLRRMKRPYRRRDAERAVQGAVDTAERFGVGADLIVGFPGESEQDFTETFSLVQELPFTYLHVFRYSARPGTPAASLSGAVQPEVVSERSQRLRSLARRKQQEFARSLLGRWHEAIVEAPAEQPGWHRATADCYASVHVPGAWMPGKAIRFLAHRLTGDVLVADAVEELPDSTPAPEVSPHE